MDIFKVLQARLQELIIVSKELSKSNSEDKHTNERLISEIKASRESDEDVVNNRARLAEIRKINTFAYMRSNELNINIRSMNEIYSVLLLSGQDIGLSPEDVEVLSFNLSNVKPTFIIDKNKLVFFNQDVEEMTVKKIMESIGTDDDVFIKKIKSENG